MITLVGVYAFMLIPIWIPVIAVTVSWLADACRRTPDRLRSAGARVLVDQRHLVVQGGTSQVP